MAADWDAEPSRTECTSQGAFCLAATLVQKQPTNTGWDQAKHRRAEGLTRDQRQAGCLGQGCRFDDLCWS